MVIKWGGVDYPIPDSPPKKLIEYCRELDVELKGDFDSISNKQFKKVTQLILGKSLYNDIEESPDRMHYRMWATWRIIKAWGDCPELDFLKKEP